MIDSILLTIHGKIDLRPCAASVVQEYVGTSTHSDLDLY